MEMPINRYQCEWVGIDMQRMHYSYKCMQAQQKKLSGCASNSLAHEHLGKFEEAHHWNIQAKFYNEEFPLVYESDNIWDSLYEEHGATLKHNIWDSLYHGATLKHKCGKKDSNITPFCFFGGLLWTLFLFGLLWPLLFFIKSRVSSRLVGES